MTKGFHSPTKGLMELDRVVEEILGYIKEQPDRKYSIVVGTDSYPSGSVDYVTAIVVHRQGRGGRYFWKKEHQQGKTPVMRHRIYQETTHSIKTAQDLIKKLNLKKLAGYDFAIHIDVGNSGSTRDMINEVVGMVKGNGFTAMTKPEAYAASTVADRYT
jgi:predicted RNase H-related nuclease YkuK (DUF458 family)